LHAAIGLNLDLWDSAHDLLTTRLEMPGMTADHRKELTSAYVKLESPSAHLHERRARVLLGAIDRRADDLATPDAMTGSDLMTGLVEVAERMEPNKAAEILITAMAKTTEFDSLTKLASGLVEVVKRTSGSSSGSSARTSCPSTSSRRQNEQSPRTGQKPDGRVATAGVPIGHGYRNSRSPAAGSSLSFGLVEFRVCDCEIFLLS
jgi:hypothetical protein